MPCAGLLDGALEVWILRLRLTITHLNIYILLLEDLYSEINETWHHNLGLTPTGTIDITSKRWQWKCFIGGKMAGLMSWPVSTKGTSLRLIEESTLKVALKSRLSWKAICFWRSPEWKRLQPFPIMSTFISAGNKSFQRSSCTSLLSLSLLLLRLERNWSVHHTPIGADPFPLSESDGHQAMDGGLPSPAAAVRRRLSVSCRRL